MSLGARTRAVLRLVSPRTSRAFHATRSVRTGLTLNETTKKDDASHIYLRTPQKNPAFDGVKYQEFTYANDFRGALAHMEKLHRDGKRFVKAEEFLQLLEPFAQAGESQSCERLLHDMGERGLDIPEQCWSQLMVAYGRARDMDGCIKLLRRIATRNASLGTEPQLHINGRDALMSMYIDSGDVVLLAPSTTTHTRAPY